MADYDFDINRRQRSASVDGFLSGVGQQPRRPVFANPSPAIPKSPASIPTPKRTLDFRLPPVVTTPPREKEATPAEPVRSSSSQSSSSAAATAAALPQAALSAKFAQATAAREYAAARSQSPTPTLPSRQSGVKAVKAVKAPAKPPRTKRRIVKRVFKILGVLLLVAIIGLGIRFFHDIAKLTGNSNPFALLSSLQKSPMKNENGRVNILVAGNSADDKGHNGANLTDSIMVLSLDTNKKTAMMLSIPRDMWVKIPGHGHAKINAAYPYGGMDLLASVIEDDLNIPIHYKVLVNYSAFRDLVNAVGGISIDIQSSDPRGIYDPNIDYTTRNCCALAKYPNGWVTLNGKQALNLARARGDPNPYGIPYGFDQGDFTRTEHQRQMLIAVAKKAKSSSVLANPLKISNLISAVSNNVKTDLTIGEIETLASYVKDINLDTIDSYNINTLKGGNTTMLANYTSPDGESALIPAAGIDDYSAIAAQIQKVLTATPVQKEAANVVVLNATDTVGLAKDESVKLENEGMTIAALGDAKVQDNVTIIDNTKGKKPATIASLKKRYNATVTTDAVLSADYPGADIIVVLGKSAVPAPTTTSTN